MSGSHLPYAKKSLGQHWLTDDASLQAMCDAAEITNDDVVLEIGPGIGTLTEKLVQQAREVIAVEFDERFAVELAGKFTDANFRVVHEDILKFNLMELPPGYKVVANIPYYLTSNLLRVLSESPNPPSVIALLVQKEVAERVAAAPGSMSLLSVSVQLYYRPELRQVVPAELFTPPPKVDSQIIKLARHSTPLFADLDTKLFFQVVRAGFGERRKKLRSSLSGGLRLPKPQVDELLQQAGIDPDLRAQALSLDEWHRLYQVVQAATKNT